MLYGRVAQLVRALHSHCKGLWFESRRDHMNKKNVIFCLTWIVVLSFAFVTLINAPPLIFPVTASVKLTNLFLRGLGLIAFSMLFVQIVLGAFIDKFAKKFGSWVYKFHIFEGIITYLLIFLHPVFFVIFNYLLGSKFDPYVAFVNICLLCKTPLDYFYSIGRISFILLSITSFAALFRNANPWLKTNWSKFHTLNYFIFIFIGIHGYYLGSDFRSQPFFTFAILAYLTVLGIVIFIKIPDFYKKFKLWVKD